MKKLNPFQQLALYCVDIAAAEYISGRMSFDEAIEYGFELTDKYAETEEFNKIVDDFYDSFVDIKDILLGEKDVLIGGTNESIF